MIMSGIQEIKNLDKNAPMHCRPGEGAARRIDFSARQGTINQRTNQPTNESIHEPTKRILGSMFAKASYARRNLQPRKELHSTSAAPSRTPRANLILSRS